MNASAPLILQIDTVTALSFGLAAWSYWGPADTAPSREDTAAVPALKSLAPLKRRRLSGIGRAAYHCAIEACGDRAPAASVFLSDHGELVRSVALLQSVASNEPLSPNAFSLSVHNAIAGLFSIFTDSRSPSTSVAAGCEGFGAGLLEVAALSGAYGAPALLVAYDEPLPPPFADHVPDGPPQPCAIALLLTTEASHPQLHCERTPARHSDANPSPLWLQLRRIADWLGSGSDCLELRCGAATWVLRR